MHFAYPIQSLEQLRSKANETNQPVMNVAESIALGKIPDIKPPIRKKLLRLINPLLKLSDMVKKVMILCNN